MAFVFGVVAAFEGAVPFVFELEVEARDGLAFDEDIFGAQVALFVEVARGPDEDLCNLLHVGGDQVHANVYYI